MIDVEVLIVGGGPAGLCAGISAAESGANVLIIERRDILGGQLIKQTHMFFGSEKQYAGTRGIDITKILINKLNSFSNIKIERNSTVLSIFDDGIVSVDFNGKYKKIHPKKIVIATGAAEKSLAFINNDLPGIYGAGAVQTLMNLHGIKPGNNVLMVGAGNIGLIVSYQLLQAGVNVKAILDASPTIGGYLVHASKIRRMGVPIYTRHTVKRADGKNCLESAVIVELDENWSEIDGTEKKLDVDVICVSVGLSPLTELLFQAGCKIKMIREFGGYVPVRTKNLQTTNSNIFIAGDVGGIEEASSAMVGGHIAGLSVAEALGYVHPEYDILIEDYQNQLSSLRSGHSGDRIRAGLLKATIN